MEQNTELNLQMVELMERNEHTMEITVPWSHFDEPERMAILDVLRRDAQLRAQELERVRRLKAEIQQLKRKGALKVNAENSSPLSSARSCGRCRVELGRIINRGAICRTCKQRVCKNCREFNLRGTDWVCTLCAKNAELQAVTSEWMNVFVRRPSRRRNSKDYVAPGDIVAKSIKRCWTISNPSGSKGNRDPELRSYNTLGHPHKNHPSHASSTPSGTSRHFPSSPPSSKDDDDDVAASPAGRRKPHHPRLAPRRSASLSQADLLDMEPSTHPPNTHRSRYRDFPSNTPSPTSPTRWNAQPSSPWSSLGGLPPAERNSVKRSNSSVNESMDLHYSQRSKSMDRVQYYQNNYPTPVPVPYSVESVAPNPPSNKEYVLYLDRETVPVPVFRDNNDPYLYCANTEIPYRERTQSMDRGTAGSSKIRMGTRSTGPHRFTSTKESQSTSHRPSRDLSLDTSVPNYLRMGPSVPKPNPPSGMYPTGSLDRLLVSDKGKRNSQQRINDQQRQQNINRVYIDGGGDDPKVSPQLNGKLHSTASHRTGTLLEATSSGISVHMTHQTLSPSRPNSLTNSKSGRRSPQLIVTLPTTPPASPSKLSQKQWKDEERDFFPQDEAVGGSATLPRVSKKLPAIPRTATGTITKVYLKNSPPAGKPSPPASSSSVSNALWNSYDVEHATGTVFRKVTVMKTQEHERQSQTTYTGRHSEEDVFTAATTKVRRSHSHRRTTQERTTTYTTVREPSCSAQEGGSDSANEEIALNSEKMLPGGDDYRLVFISSEDSSKSSLDEDPSFEDETRGLPNEADHAGFIDETDWEEDSHPKPLPQRRLLSSSSTKRKSRHGGTRVNDSASSTTSSSSIRTSQKGQGAPRSRANSSILEGSLTSSWETNSPKTFLIDDFHQYAWGSDSPAQNADDSQLPIPVTTTVTREVQTDPMGSLDESEFQLLLSDFETSDTRLNHLNWLSGEDVNPGSPTRSLGEWETASHHIRTPSSLSYFKFSVTDDVPGAYLPIWQPPLSRRSSLQSLNSISAESWCPNDEFPEVFAEERSVKSFHRSDSKRSSGERSLEELQLTADHMLASSALVADSSAFLSSLYSPQGTALPGLHEYRNQILQEIQTYTSKGDWNLADNLLSQSDKPLVHSVTANPPDVFSSTPVPNGSQSLSNASQIRPKPALRLRNNNPNYRIWPTGLPSARAGALLSTKRWKPCSVLMETDEPFLWDSEADAVTALPREDAVKVRHANGRWPAESLFLPGSHSLKERKSGCKSEKPPVAGFRPEAPCPSDKDLLSSRAKPAVAEQELPAPQEPCPAVGTSEHNYFWERVPLHPAKSTSDLRDLPSDDENQVRRVLKHLDTVDAAATVKALLPSEQDKDKLSHSDLQLLPEKLAKEVQPTFSCSNYVADDPAPENNNHNNGKSNNQNSPQACQSEPENALPAYTASSPLPLFPKESLALLPIKACEGIEKEGEESPVGKTIDEVQEGEKGKEEWEKRDSTRAKNMHDPDEPQHNINDTAPITTTPVTFHALPHVAKPAVIQTEPAQGMLEHEQPLPHRSEARARVELTSESEEKGRDEGPIEPEVNDLGHITEMEHVSDTEGPTKSNNETVEEKGEEPQVTGIDSSPALVSSDALKASENVAELAEKRDECSPDSIESHAHSMSDSCATLGPSAPHCDASEANRSEVESAIAKESNNKCSRFQVTRASTPEVRDNCKEYVTKARRLPSDSEGVTSEGDDESPGFETDSQQNTVVEGHGQYQNLRQFALKQSRSASPCSSGSQMKESELEGSSVPASPVLLDGRLTPQRKTSSGSGTGGQYTSYILITQEGSNAEDPPVLATPENDQETSKGEEEALEGASSRVTVTVPAPEFEEDSNSVRVVATSTVESENALAEDDLTLRTECDQQWSEEEDGSCVTISGNGTLTEFDDKDSDGGSSRLGHSEIEDELAEEADLQLRESSTLARYFTLTLETGFNTPRKQPVTHRNTVVANDPEEKSMASTSTGEDDSFQDDSSDPSERYVDDVESNYSESASSGDEAYLDREEELRGYHRAIDFTLHTILEESCEESDGERRTKEEKKRADPSALEKYFTMGLAAEESTKDLNDSSRQDSTSRRRGSSGCANEESEFSDSFSETSSSIYSEALESVEETLAGDGVSTDPVDLASSRLEKYFLTGFLGLEAVNPGVGEPGNASDGGPSTDGSESVGSDSEGHPSPEQRRRKVIKARGARPSNTFAHHSNLLFPDWPGPPLRTGAGKDFRSIESISPSSSVQTLANSSSFALGAEASSNPDGAAASSSEDGDQKDKNEGNEQDKAFEKADGHFDTIKRRKKTKRGTATEFSNSADSVPEEENVAVCASPNSATERIATPTNEAPEAVLEATPPLSEDKDDSASSKYQSRDSGFIGSCDDLLTENSVARSVTTPPSSNSSSDDVEAKANETKSDTADTKSTKSLESTGSSTKGIFGNRHAPLGTRPHTSAKVTRKDSFNNWSSDEETNLMMNKMRAFFRNMIQVAPVVAPPSVTPPPNPVQSDLAHRVKPPQLIAFENELTRLMKTVPGINDEQVKEIVEYLSSEDTWSDSYDSSDYTSSDLEGAYYAAAALESTTVPDLQLDLMKSPLQEQISASCQEIIEQFDVSHPQEPPPASDDPANSLTKETALVYQRIMSSLIRTQSQQQQLPKSPQLLPAHQSPPLIAKVLHHIGNRLVALMHEVSNSDTNSHSGSLDEHNNVVTSSPRIRGKSLPRASTGPYHKGASSTDSGSIDEKSSLHSTSFDSTESPTDTEQSPESSDDLEPKNTRTSPAGAGTEKMSSLPLLFGSEHRLARDEVRGYVSLESHTQSLRSTTLPYQPRYKSRTGEKNRHSLPDASALVSPSAEDEKNHEDQDENEDRFVKKVRALPRFSVFRSSRESREALQSSSSGISDIAEERDEFSGWRSSFESAIAADSRTKLSLEAKRRSAGSGGSSSELFASRSSDHLLLERESHHMGIGSRIRSRPGGHSSKFSLPNLLERDAVRLAKERERERERSASSDVLLSTSPVASHSLLGVIDQREEEDAEWDLLRRSTRLSARRRSSVPDTRSEERRSNDLSPEPRSTTLPRTVTGFSVANTGSTGSISSNLPGSTVSSSHTELLKSLGVLNAGTSASASSLNTSSTTNHVDTPAKSARYRAPGYRQQASAGTPNRFSQRTPSAPGLGQHQGLPWSSSLSSRKHIRSMFSDDHNDANSTPPFVREGLRTSIASAASGESFSSVSGTETQEDAESGIVKQRSTSLSALGTRSDSLASVYSAAGEARYGTVTVKGEVQFALFYNYRQSELQVLVKQCRDLAPVDVKRSRSDPYVKVYLLPDRSKSGKRKTKVKKHTLSPVFDENLKFPTTLNELDTRTLWLTVWHSDMFGRNDFLGEVLLPLAGKIFDDITPRWYSLQERTEPLEDSLVAPLSYGDLIVALKYLPPEALASKKGRKSKGALHILVKEAKNLISVRSNGLADPICKSCLIPEKYKQSKQKTSVCKRTLNPTWNHTFIYEGVTLEELKERCIEITIWDHDRLGSKDFMGGVRFNSGIGEYQGKAVDWADARGNELTLWQNMLERPNLWFEGLVPLRTFKEKPQD